MMVCFSYFPKFVAPSCFYFFNLKRYSGTSNFSLVSPTTPCLQTVCTADVYVCKFFSGPSGFAVAVIHMYFIQTCGACRSANVYRKAVFPEALMERFGLSADWKHIPVVRQRVAHCLPVFLPFCLFLKVSLSRPLLG